ncbi:hypothetical protein SDC9_21223 [bioreactor metagenome]|uniref:Uncharacterized protein n=1 Tax=bioreactor metagenome TaxID=1076179 RepID=A0A644U8X9_9ZZZZ
MGKEIKNFLGYFMDIPYDLTMSGLLKEQNKILILKRYPNSKINSLYSELVGLR